MTNDRRISSLISCLGRTAVAGMVAALLAASGAHAQQAATSEMPGLKLNKDEPIQIESDKLEIHDQQSTATFTGKVKVIQGTTTLQSGIMTVFYKKKQPPADGSAAKPADTPAKPAAKAGQSDSLVSGDADIDHIVVSDKVYLVSGTQTATADDGSFDMANQLAVLTGQKVVLTDGPNVFTGCKLTVHMDTGQAVLDSCGGRVQVQLDPKSKPTEQPKK